MLAIISVVLLTSVVGGFLLEGADHSALQPVELLIIGGAAGSSLIISAGLCKTIIKISIHAQSKQRQQMAMNHSCLFELLN